ncbi:MAG: hypothetical protein GC205_00915 [Bacteroidetes bacterium]|nr:hypothetical protein [Bacteroidota bacterium]
MNDQASNPERRSCRQPALQAGLHYYFDPFGRMVFTAHYLLERGYCCKSGCRHCPYGYAPPTDSPDSK